MDLFDQILKRLRSPKTPAEQAEEIFCCPECSYEFTKLELLNNNNYCLKCGAVINTEKKVKVFS